MLKHGDRGSITSMFQRMKDEASQIVESCISLTYFMRGAISYESMLCRSPAERQRINDFIEKRLEIETKKMNPVY